jgi:hypothetical protein
MQAGWTDSENFWRLFAFGQFLLGKAQPKNALINPPPPIRNRMQTFKRAHSRAQGTYDVTILHFLQLYNFQASTNHTEKAWSGYFFPRIKFCINFWQKRFGLQFRRFFFLKLIWISGMQRRAEKS